MPRTLEDRFIMTAVSCLTQSLAACAVLSSLLPILLAMQEKHVITIICVVNLEAGRRRKRGIVVVVAPSHLQTSGLVNVMGAASISASFRPPVRPFASLLTVFRSRWSKTESPFPQKETESIQPCGSLMLLACLLSQVVSSLSPD